MCFATRSLKWPLMETPNRGVMTLVAAPALKRRGGNAFVVGWPDCAWASSVQARTAQRLKQIRLNLIFIGTEVFPSPSHQSGGSQELAAGHESFLVPVHRTRNQAGILGGSCGAAHQHINQPERDHQ